MSKCKKCRGTGRLFDHYDGLVTLGIDYLFQMVIPKIGKKICVKCGGTGKKIRVVR